MNLIHVHQKVQVPLLGTWKWSKEDHDVPLLFRFTGATTSLKLGYNSHRRRDREVVFEADLCIEFSNPNAEFVRGLRTTGRLARNASEIIYKHYVATLEYFEGALRTAGGVRNLGPVRAASIHDFFGTNGLSEPCRWQINGSDLRKFTPKLTKGSRGLNPLFRQDQILTKSKWRKLQLALDNHEHPSAEMMQLLRLRADLQWKDKSIPTIEAAILVETILREYAEKALLGCGFSKNKIKSLRDELTFNTFLNVVLPLSLRRKEAAAIEEQIRRVDTLRRIRNDIVHGNIQKSEIDETNVRNGIEGALKLVSFIRTKLRAA